MTQTKPVEPEIKFICTEDGHAVQKKNGLIHATVPIDKYPEGEKVESELTFVGKKIQGPMFRSWQAFAREVAKRNNGNAEAALTLFYNPVEKKWNAYPPKQDLSAAHVDYSGMTEVVMKFREKHGKDWMVAGTFHSHPDSAFASFTDEKDEEKMDGVHLIIPRFGHGGENGICCHITCSKERFVVKSMAFMLDFSTKGEEKYPEEWLEQIKFGRKGITHYGGHQGGGSYPAWTHASRKDSHTVNVNGKDVNLLGKRFDAIELNPLLKAIGYSKKERKFLMRYEEDLDDINKIFDHAREAVVFAAEIRGTVSGNEHDQIIEKSGRAAEAVLDCIAATCNRILKYDAAPEKKGAEEVEEAPVPEEEIIT